MWLPGRRPYVNDDDDVDVNKVVDEAFVTSEEALSGLERLKKPTPPECGRAVEGRLQVSVVLSSGESFDFDVGPLDSVLTLKAGIERRTTIPQGWQVLLTEDFTEVADDACISAYCESVEETVVLRLLVVKLRDDILAVVWGAEEFRSLALYNILEQVERGDEDVALAARVRLVDIERGFILRPSPCPLVFKILAKSLPVENAVIVLAKCVPCNIVQRIAVAELVNIVQREGPDVLEVLGQAAKDEIQRMISEVTLTMTQFRRPLRDVRPRPFKDITAIETARRHLSCHLEGARSFNSGQHFRVSVRLPENSAYVDVEPQIQAAAAMIHGTADAPGLIGNKIHLSMTDSNGFVCASDASAARFLTVTAPHKLVDFLTVTGVLDTEGAGGWDDEVPVDLLCSIAEMSGLSCEHTRMALEVLRFRVPEGHRGALGAACWAAGHRDAAVREEAMLLLQRLARPADVSMIRTMLGNFWERDAHARRIEQELAVAEAQTCQSPKEVRAVTPSTDFQLVHLA